MDEQQAKAWIELEGQGVTDERDKRTICPFCGGGQSSEVSFIIYRRDGRLKGHCYRASCGKGITSGTRTVVSGAPKKAFKSRVYEGGTRVCPPKLYAFFNDRYSFTKEEIDREQIRYGDNGRMVCPVFDRHGKRYGYNLKRTRNTIDDAAKWLTYFEKETNRLHYPLGFKKNYRYPQIVLVEDILSAIRVARMSPVVALQGTNLNWEQAKELLDQTGKLIVALDPDKGGVSAAFRIQEKYSSTFSEGVEAKLLVADPKEYPSDKALKYDLGV